MSDDLLAREAVERLEGKESPAFFEELWDRIQANERASVRRWRALAVGATVAALAAVASAGVLAAGRDSNVVDQTLQCATSPPGFLAKANATAPATASGSKPLPAGVLLYSGRDKLLAFDAAHAGVSLNRVVCGTAKKIPLTRSGLPSAGVFKAGYYTGFGRGCFLPGRFVFRLRLVHDDAGVPTSATLVVRLVKRATPLLFIAWSPNRVATYASSRCR